MYQSYIDMSSHLVSFHLKSILTDFNVCHFFLSTLSPLISSLSLLNISFLIAEMKISDSCFIILPSIPHLPFSLHASLIATLYLWWLIFFPLISAHLLLWRLMLLLFSLRNHLLVKSTAVIQSALTALIASRDTLPSGTWSEGGQGKGNNWIGGSGCENDREPHYSSLLCRGLTWWWRSSHRLDLTEMVRCMQTRTYV